MNRLNYFLVLLFVVFITGCHHTGKRSSRVMAAVKAMVNDTIWVDDSASYYVEMMHDKMDSAAKIEFFTGLITGKLMAHANESRFDTAVLLNGFNGHIYFYQGSVFSNRHPNALVYIHDNDEDPILLFTKNGNWKLKQVIYGHGALEENAIRFPDYNFDGRKDLVIAWNYIGGRCSCGTSDCWDVYLYNETYDSLMQVPGLDNYLDFGLSEKEKAVYLGNHCDGFYGKFKWSGNKLTKVEAYLGDGQNSSDSSIMKHVLYKNRQEIMVGKKRNGEIPSSWERILEPDR